MTDQENKTEDWLEGMDDKDHRSWIKYGHPHFSKNEIINLVYAVLAMFLIFSLLALIAFFSA